MIASLEKYIAPAVVSLGLHGAIFAFLFWGLSSVPSPPVMHKPNFVQAKLVTLEDKSKVQKPAESKPQIVDLTQKRREQERQQAEQKRQQEAKRREEEKNRQAELERRKEQERKAQEKKARDKAEAERKAKAETDKLNQERLRQQQEAQAFEQALAREEASLLEETYAVTAQSYMTAIAQRVIQNWSRPPSARNGMQSILLIRLVPTGRIVSVDILKGSGNAAFDLSAVQAVKKVEQFDEVKDMPLEVFERHYREFEFNFNPQDLRQ